MVSNPPYDRLNALLDRLTPQQQREVAAFAQASAERPGNERARVAGLPGEPGRLRLDWAGGLKDLRSQFTSVDLQHKANEWRHG